MFHNRIEHILFIYFWFTCLRALGCLGTTTQDMHSTRANTLIDDADNIQRQLNNEIKDRLKNSRPQTIWILHCQANQELHHPTITEKLNYEYLENTDRKRRESDLPSYYAEKAIANQCSVTGWKYREQHEWKSTYPACGGSSQSPVNVPMQGLIRTSASRQLLFSKYNQPPQRLVLQREGETVLVYGDWGADRPFIYGGAAHSRRYVFHSLAVRRPSEHPIGGLLYPLEIQAMHYSVEYGSLHEALDSAEKDKSAVLVVANIYKHSTRDHPGIQQLVRSIISEADNVTLQALPLIAFSPPLREYAAYHGSLTTPPCTEAVLWLIRARALPITRQLAEDLDKFSHFTAEQISKLRPSQSPIAINLQRCPTWTSLDPLRFKGYWDNKANGILLNNGSTAYFAFETPVRPTLSGGPLLGEYIFEQMHFHWSVDDFTGCEHVLDGHGYAAECHFVHYNSKYESMEAAVGHPDGLAVVGFLLEAVDAPNPRFDKLVEGLEGIKKRESVVHVTSESLSWMDRSDLSEGSYVTYKGSLTTPPYTECVTWIIYEDPVQIGAEQLGLLRDLEGPENIPIERNVRPTQRHPPGHSVIYVKQVKSKL